MKLHPQTQQAYQLLHNGTLAFARAEQQGIRVDVEYAEKAKQEITDKIADLKQSLYSTKFYKHWEHVSKNVSINSNAQLAHYLYKVKKLEPATKTESGQGSTEEDALRQLNIPELDQILEIRKLKKIRDTYLEGFIREQVDGYMHPSFNLHLVRTFRSCVAKGTKILVMRDFKESPNGIPIEQVKEGDYVYCFDDELNPTIQKVLWTGKTGHKEVIRIHWVARGGREGGYLDVTPEHLVRLVDGAYVKAKNLDPSCYDYRKETDNKRSSKVRVLSCARVGDSLRFTGHLKHGNGILEHRLIYDHFNNDLNDDDVIHHKDGDHLNHTLSNLEKTTLSKHSKYHALTRPKHITDRCIQALRDNRHKIKYKKGIDHPNSLRLTKWQCLRILSRARGKLTKIDYDFSTFKQYLILHNIDPKVIRRRYNYFGEYFSKQKINKLHPLGRAKVSEITRIGYYHLKELYDQYGIDSQSRKWGNQFGEFIPGNHVITRVEKINKTVDVYDIEVEKYHNFFANEICIHNSSDRPNFQNIPKRDKEAMETTRKALFPRPGHQLLEVDYKGLEVSIATCYNHDPTMVKYMKDPTTDMHKDMAEQIYKMKLDKGIPSHAKLRSAAKNGFVFPQFYGDYYGNNALSLACDWGGLSKDRKWKRGDGIELVEGTLGDHLIDEGFRSLGMFTDHIKEIEKDFWKNRFPEYARWKDRWWKAYQKYGHIDLLTGFRCSGVMGRNDCTNYPVQGAAFHCLLWSFIRLDQIMRKEKWDTRLVGQIHDAIILDVHPDELDHVVQAIRRVTCEELPQAWPWIIVPLNVDAEICPIDGSWAEKEYCPI